MRRWPDNSSAAPPPCRIGSRPMALFSRRATSRFPARPLSFWAAGKRFFNALYATAERLGVHMVYGQRIDAVDVNGGAAGPFRARSIIACCGGEQADAAYDVFINRGTPFAKGEVLRSLLSQGAASAGRPRAARLVAVDARFAGPDGGIITRVDGMEHGMVVDEAGRRFQDETAIRGPTRYAAWGQAVAGLPGKRAALILDAAGMRRISLYAFPPIGAQTPPELASLLRLDPVDLAQSGKASGRVGEPPFFAFPIRPGITFTCLGVRVDEKARVIREDGGPFPGVFAAGMIMAPNVLGTGYVAGCGMTIGAVFGRIAGEEAARHALG